MQQGKYFRIQEEIHLGENMLKNKIKSQEKKYSSAHFVRQNVWELNDHTESKLLLLKWPIKL